MAGLALLLAGSLTTTTLVATEAQAAAANLSSYLTAGFSGTANPGSVMRLDATFDWTASEKAYPNQPGGTAGTTYFKKFVSDTNAGTALAPWGSATGTETFSIYSASGASSQTPYGALQTSPTEPYTPAGWTFTRPTTRQPTGVGFSSWNVNVPTNTVLGLYNVTVVWKFASTGSSKGITTLSVTVPVTITAAPTKPTPTTPDPVISNGVTNGGFELGSANWLTGGDAIAQLDSTLAASGSGFARLGGTEATGQQPAARIGWIANSAIVVPSSTHATLKFSHKTTTSEPTKDGFARDQISVFVTDETGVHLQSAWTNLNEVAATAKYTTASINMDAYRGKTVSIAFLLTQDYLNPTTMLIDDISVGETATAALAGTIATQVTGYSTVTKLVTAAALGFVAGMLIDTAAVSSILVLAGVKTGLVALGLTNPVLGLIGATIAIAGIGCYLLYNSYYQKTATASWNESMATSPAITQISTGRSSRPDPTLTYIIELKPTDKSKVTKTADAVAKKYSTLATASGSSATPVTINFYYTNFSGFSATMTPGTANRMQADAPLTDSTVLFVGLNGTQVPATEAWPSPAGTPGSTTVNRPADRQVIVPRALPKPNKTSDNINFWNLARISQRDLTPKPASVSPLSTGAGVNVYVVDTGLTVKTKNATGQEVINPEFTDAAGTSRIVDAYQVPANGMQANSNSLSRINSMSDDSRNPHGTAVTAVIAGRTYGVSPGASIIPVSVARQVAGVQVVTDETVLAGLEWVANDFSAWANGPRFIQNIVNVSIAAPVALPLAQSNMLKDAYRDIGASNLVVLAPPNENLDACNLGAYSLSKSEPNLGILVVGAADENDSIAYTSNSWGDCLSLYAPGDNIPVPVSLAAPSGYANGASLAAAMATGAAAQLLGHYYSSARVANAPILNGPKLKQLIVDRATPGVVKRVKTTNGTIVGNPGAPNLVNEATAPQNRLLYLGAECSRTDPTWWSNSAGSNAHNTVPDPLLDPACPSASWTSSTVTIFAAIPSNGGKPGELRGNLFHMRTNMLGQPEVFETTNLAVSNWTLSTDGLSYFAAGLTVPGDPMGSSATYWKFEPILAKGSAKLANVISWIMIPSS